MPKPKTYACPKCSRSITLYIKPSAAPLCSNPDRHTNIHIPMEEKPNDEHPTQ